MSKIHTNDLHPSLSDSHVLVATRVKISTGASDRSSPLVIPVTDSGSQAEVYRVHEEEEGPAVDTLLEQGVNALLDYLEKHPEVILFSLLLSGTSVRIPVTGSHWFSVLCAVGCG